MTFLSGEGVSEGVNCLKANCNDSKTWEAPVKREA